MPRRTWKSRLIVVALVLNLAHAPFPVCDGDDIVLNSPDVSINAIAEAQEDPKQLDDNGLDISVPILQDVDFILLGYDPPEDSDEGPIDPTPERSEDYYLVATSNFKPSTGRSKSFCISFTFALSVSPDSAVESIECSKVIRDRHRSRSFSTTFIDSPTWRTLLSVMTC